MGKRQAGRNAGRSAGPFVAPMRGQDFGVEDDRGAATVFAAAAVSVAAAEVKAPRGGHCIRTQKGFADVESDGQYPPISIPPRWS